MPLVKHTLYITRKLYDVKLVTHEGRICLIVPNYTEVFEQPVVTGDEAVKCYRIEVAENEVLQQQDGAVNKLLLWLGDTSSRARPHDMLTLPCESLIPISGQAASAVGLPPKEVAAAIFDAYPLDVRLAAILSNTPPELIAGFFGLSAEQATAVLVKANGVLAKSAGA